MFAGNVILLAAVFAIAFVPLCTLAEECIYDDRGLCLSRCPPNTYSYSPGCGVGVKSQRTCRQPVARSLGMICDYSRCDCYSPKVWDEAAEKCVMYKDCSDQTKAGRFDDRV